MTVHIPGGAATKGLIDARVLSALAPGILINTSRGGIVDEDALLSWLDRGSNWAGLDVFVNEPEGSVAEWRSKIARHPQVVATPHIGAATLQSQLAVANGTLKVIETFAAGFQPTPED
jgi:phosphoglycerate dehydrogenase-like enzyme